MATTVSTKFHKEPNVHMAQLSVEHTSYNFNIEITLCESIEDIKTLVVHILQRGNLEPIFEGYFPDLCVVGGSKLNTRKFGVPNNPNFKIPFLCIIKTIEEDVDMSKFGFDVTCTSILA